MIKVIKKDGTKEEFNVQKVIVAVNKSAYRALVKFTDEEIDFICKFVTEKVEQMRKKEVTISDMHNVVESALEQTNPLVAKSYRDYRNYKQDFVQMLDEVYKKSQSIMYIGDKENSNTDSATHWTWDSDFLEMWFRISAFWESRACKEFSVWSVFDNHVSSTFITDNVCYFVFDLDFL